MRQMFGGQVTKYQKCFNGRDFILVTIRVDDAYPKYNEMTLDYFGEITIKLNEGDYGYTFFVDQFEDLIKGKNNVKLLGEIWSDGRFIKVKLDGVCEAPADYYERPNIMIVEKKISRKIKQIELW